MKNTFYKILFALSFLVLLFGAQSIYAQQSLQWFKTFGSNAVDQGNSVISDHEENVYVAGSFSNTMQMGSKTLTSKGDVDGFVAKLDSAGNTIWATSFGSKANEGNYGNNPGQICFAKDGNILVTGMLLDTCTFGTQQLIASGYSDMFVAKLNAQTGDFMWVKTGGGPYTYSQGNVIADDGLGNILVGGDVYGTAYFGQDTIVSKGLSDFFIAKYDSGGTLTWLNSYGSPGSEDITGISTDANLNIYFSGIFQDTIHVGNILLSSQGGLDICWGKVAPDGTALWAKGAGGKKAERAQKIKTLPDGRFYLGGWTSDTIAFEGASIPDNGNGNIFLSFFDTNGKMKWVRSGYSVNAGDLLRDIAIDNAGNAYIAGQSNFVILRLEDPDGGRVEASEASGCPFGDLIAAKYDTTGNLMWLGHTLGNNYNLAEGVAIDNLGNCYVTGYFTDSISYNNIWVEGNGGSDVLLFKLKDHSFVTATEDNAGNNFLRSYLYPNPTSGNSFIKIESSQKEQVTVSLIDLSGRLIRQYNPLSINSGTSIIPFSVDISPGLYFLNIAGENHTSVLKFIVQ